ncbi:hypothetical protein ACFLWX_00920 [Chloroflexota bacterium]
MTEQSPAHNLLEYLMVRIRLPWYWATVAVAAALIVFLVLAAYMWDNRASWPELGFWRDGLQQPVILVYILVTYRLLKRLHRQAIGTFRPLLLSEASVSTMEKAESFSLRRHWEWLAVLLGPIIWIALNPPWIWGGGGVHRTAFGPT